MTAAVTFDFFCQRKTKEKINETLYEKGKNGSGLTRLNRILSDNRVPSNIFTVYI